MCSLDAREGVVVGVYGPWGSGKTSFLNLAKYAFQDMGVDVLTFDPWHFSGTGQLLNRFFDELSTKSSRINVSKEFSKYIDTYGELIGIGATLYPDTAVPFAIWKFVSYLSQRICRPQSVEEARIEIVRELEKRESPIVIMIDELDRLTREEILEVFRLVRLIGRFPNIIYIVACDREQVEKALDWNRDGHSGRKYMEKIIQYPVNLPDISNQVLAHQLDHKLRDIFDSANLGGVITNDRWPDIRSTIVSPLLKNLRDVNRFLTVVRASVDDLYGIVTAVDVIALEAVRMFLPDTFVVLPTVIDVLTVVLNDEEDQQKYREEIEPNQDSYRAGWGQHTDLEFQKAKVERMLKKSDEVDSQSRDTGRTSHIESMVTSSLMDIVFEPARASVFGGDRKAFTRDPIEDRKRAYFRHVFQAYFVRIVGRKDGS